LCRGLDNSLTERHGRGMVRARHGRGMACMYKTRPHCVNQMEKTQSKHLAVRFGRERHGHDMVCVNSPYVCSEKLEMVQLA
jgi:hypothetical protein